MALGTAVTLSVVFIVFLRVLNADKLIKVLNVIACFEDELIVRQTHLAARKCHLRIDFGAEVV